jgi:uncharacterized protein YraI
MILFNLNVFQIRLKGIHSMNLMKMTKILTTVGLATSILVSGSLTANATPSLNASMQTINAPALSVNVLTKASVKQMKTTAKLNVRSNAGLKYKRIATLKKGATVTVNGTKPGWAKVESGKTSGWVSSKYLTTIKKISVKKPPAKKQTSKKISIKSVKSYSDAQKYLKQHCPNVKIKKISGYTSHYNPNNNTIAVSQAHTKSYRMGFVFAHELSHHYQWSAFYKTRVNQWSKDVRNKKIERQADKMAYHMYGGVGQGFYNKKKASGKELTNVKNMISNGQKRGCK